MLLYIPFTSLLIKQSLKKLPLNTLIQENRVVTCIRIVMTSDFNFEQTS